jgi:methylmalonyl-CoA/ethylmalonyl-CoA epimerase
MIDRISHIGVVVHDLVRATEFWCETYGLKKYAEYETDVEQIKACLLSVNGEPGEMSVELIEPLDKSDLSNPVARRLARSGEGFYHLAVKVDDVTDSGKTLENKGLQVLYRAPVEGQSGGRWLVHPRSSHGIMVEGI